jgi:hypothetical protein
VKKGRYFEEISFRLGCYVADGREMPFGDETKEGQNIETNNKYQEVEIRRRKLY